MGGLRRAEATRAEHLLPRHAQTFEDVVHEEEHTAGAVRAADPLTRRHLEPSVRKLKPLHHALDKPVCTNDPEKRLHALPFINQELFPHAIFYLFAQLVLLKDFVAKHLKREPLHEQGPPTNALGPGSSTVS